MDRVYHLSAGEGGGIRLSSQVNLNWRCSVRSNKSVQADMTASCCVITVM